MPANEVRLNVIKTESTDPYVNLAAEEFLTMNAEDGTMTLFLWQNKPTVVIGRNQNPWRECDVEAIKRDGICLARRMSGGGAVYHDLGNLNFTFIAKDGVFDVAKQTDVILKACRLLGVNAIKTGRNDLTVGGCKFSGHAYYSSRGYNYHHGTIMMDVISGDLPKYLNVPDSKLKSKGVSSVRSRVTNLRDHLDARSAGLDTAELIAEMQDAIVKAAETEYSAGTVASPLPCIPRELIEKYSSEDWRLGKRIRFEKESIHRFDWGEVQIQLSMKGGYIDKCRLFSDSLETDMFGELERLLTGCRYDRADILGLKLPEGISANAYEVLVLIASSI